MSAPSKLLLLFDKLIDEVSTVTQTSSVNVNDTCQCKDFKVLLEENSLQKEENNFLLKKLTNLEAQLQQFKLTEIQNTTAKGNNFNAAIELLTVRQKVCIRLDK